MFEPACPDRRAVREPPRHAPITHLADFVWLVDFGGGAVGEGAKETLPIAQGVWVIEGHKVTVASASAGVFTFLVLRKARSDRGS